MKRSLFIRGGAGYETKTIIDGMTVQNPYYSPVPDVISRGRFNPFLFEGTVFSTGGYSALYGQALSSVLLLETKGMTEETQTGVGLNFVQGTLSHTQKMKNSAISVAGAYTDLNPYYEVFEQNTDWVNSPIDYSGEINYRWKPSKKNNIKLGAEARDLYIDGRYGWYKGKIDEFYNAAYTELNWFATPKLALRPGLRYENSEVIHQQNLAPRFSVAYKTGKHSQVSAAYGHFYQRPDNEFHEDIEPDYHNFSLSLSKLTGLFGQFTVIYASVENIFNRDHVFGYRYSLDGKRRMPIKPASPRSYFLGIMVSIEYD